jgi:hypothetical protein
MRPNESYFALERQASCLNFRNESRADRSTDVVGVGLVQKLTSRVPKDGQPGYTSCDEGMIGQSFW